MGVMAVCSLSLELCTTMMKLLIFAARKIVCKDMSHTAIAAAKKILFGHVAEVLQEIPHFGP